MSLQNHTPSDSTGQPRLERVADACAKIARGGYDTDQRALEVTTDRVLADLAAKKDEREVMQELARRHRDMLLSWWEQARPRLRGGAA